MMAKKRKMTSLMRTLRRLKTKPGILKVTQ